MAKVQNVENWGRAAARKRYDDGGAVKPPLNPADSPGGMNFPPHPNDWGARIGSARSSGQRSVVENETGAFRKQAYGE